MPASYPGSIPSFTTKVDQVDINWAADINRLQDEIREIARELGTSVSGSHEHVRARLQHLQSSKSDVGHTHDARYWQRSLITAKGQILAGTGSNNLQAISAPPSDRVLISDTSVSTGMAWGELTHDLFSDVGGDHYEQYALTDGTRGEFLRLVGGTMQGPVLFEGVHEKVVSLTPGGTVTVDADEGSVFSITVDQDTTFNLQDSSEFDEGTSIALIIEQDSTGDHVLSWPSSVVWMGSGEPAPTGPGTHVLASFITPDGGDTWLGVALLEYE